MLIKYKILDESIQTKIPEYATDGSACADLFYSGKDSVNIYAGDTVAIGTNLAIEIPIGYEMQIRSKSGMALSKRPKCIVWPSNLI